MSLFVNSELWEILWGGVGDGNSDSRIKPIYSEFEIGEREIASSKLKNWKSKRLTGTEEKQFEENKNNWNKMDSFEDLDAQLEQLQAQLKNDIQKVRSQKFRVKFLTFQRN